MAKKTSKQKKTQSKLNNKNAGKFAPVNPVKPPKKKQTDFKSDGATADINKIGLMNERIKDIFVYSISAIALILGFILLILNVTDTEFSLEWGNGKLRASLVGLIVMFGSLLVLWKYRSTTTIKNQKD